jgi:hypothetical protein
MRKRKTLLIIIFLLCLTLPVLAQETIITTGGNASATSGNISFSIGQVLFSTYADKDASVALGVQQPYEAMTIVAIKEIPGISLDIKLFPNPANELIFLETMNELDRNLSYFLYDSKGNLLENNYLTHRLTSIRISNYSSSMYLLKIMENNLEVKTFKIIKNQ